MRPTYKTIVISDLHLGSKGAKAKEVNEFLRTHSCHQLILNGDIIDGWQLKKGGSWKKKHTGFFRAVLKMMDRFDTEVIYLRGNHDDFLDQILPLKIGKQFSIRQDYMLSSHGKKYFITHGDIFDSITSQMKWLAYLGDIGYTFLLWLNKWYNQYRTWQVKPYYSLSQVIKQKVKAAVNFISDFEEKLTELAKAKEADGIICGHIHKAEIKQIDGITYMNSGDWVESLTALVETHSGEWQLLDYTTFDLKTELSDILWADSSLPFKAKVAGI
jgi:UDP-2,3-diacylglucosamine pyrophosphatase LpxH